MNAVPIRPTCLAISLVGVVACGGAPPRSEVPPARSARFAVLEERWATERPADWTPIAEGTFRRALDGATVELVARAEVESAVASAPPECDDDVECLRGIARSLRADQLVATTIAELGGTVLLRVRTVSTGERAQDAMQQAVVRDAGRRAVAEALLAIGRELAAPFRPNEVVEDPGWYESPWLWAGVGTTVAASAAFVIVFVLTQGGDWDVEIDPN
jgi:hypothetical protein